MHSIEIEKVGEKNECETRNAGRVFASACLYFHLCLDLVFAAEHVVYVCEVIGARGDSLRVAGGGVVLLEVGFLAEVAGLEGLLVISQLYNQKLNLQHRKLRVRRCF